MFLFLSAEMLDDMTLREMVFMLFDNCGRTFCK